MVTKFVPSPTATGGQQRAFEVARRLRALGPTTVCAFDDGSAGQEPLADLGVTVRTVPWRPRPLGVAASTLRRGSITTGRFWSTRLARLVAESTATPVDVLQIEHLQMAPYAQGVRARLRVLDLHNIESALTASYAATRRLSGTVYRAEALALRRLERSAGRRFDLVSVVTPADARAWEALGGQAVVCPNGCNPLQPPDPATGPHAVFVATMGWRPNSDAARWLVDDIWPRVLSQLPAAHLSLVGRDPPPALRACRARAVEVTGAVPSVLPFLARARVALAPLRAGGGSRLKILEALAAGRPVVATTKGAEGLEDLVGHGVVVADRPDDIATEVTGLLSDPLRAQQLGAQGRAAVADRYGWDRALAPLLQRLQAEAA